MIKVAAWLIFLGTMAYLALCALLYTRQRGMLYYPMPPTGSVSADYFMLENAGQSLKIWHVPGGGRRALIYFGGNAEDVSQNIELFKRLLPQLGMYLANYRGYGGSSGSPSEQAIYADALALYDHIRPQYDEIAVMGRSLGSGVAVYLAAQRPVSRLVLVTPFESMARLAASYYPLVPVSLLIKDRFEAAHYARQLSLPALVLIAEHDEVIPHRISEALIQALPVELTRVEVIAGAGHNTVGSAPRYQQLLESFLSNGDLQEINRP